MPCSICGFSGHNMTLRLPLPPDALRTVRDFASDRIGTHPTATPGDIGIASYINRDDVGCNAGFGCELMSYRVYNLDWSDDIAPLNYVNKTGYGFKVVRAAHATLSKLL